MLGNTYGINSSVVLSIEIGTRTKKQLLNANSHGGEIQTMLLDSGQRRQRSNRHDLLFYCLTDDAQEMISGGIVFQADADNNGDVHVIKVETPPYPYFPGFGLVGLGYLGFPYLNYNFPHI